MTKLMEIFKRLKGNGIQIRSCRGDEHISREIQAMKIDCKGNRTY